MAKTEITSREGGDPDLSSPSASIQSPIKQEDKDEKPKDKKEGDRKPKKEKEYEHPMQPQPDRGHRVPPKPNLDKIERGKW